jgi:elongation factor P
LIGGGAVGYPGRTMSQLAALDLRPGFLVSFENRVWSVVWWNILRNDRRQFVQMRIKDIMTGRIRELKEHGDTKYEVLEKDEVDLTHSYQDGSDEVFFTEDGDEVRCPKAAAEDALKWPSDRYIGLLVNGTLMFVRAPETVEITVTETSPPVKGAGSGLKDAILENGVKTRVANLVSVGEKVRVFTETGEFKERA